MINNVDVGCSQNKITFLKLKFCFLKISMNVKTHATGILANVKTHRAVTCVLVPVVMSLMRMGPVVLVCY